MAVRFTICEDEKEIVEQLREYITYLCEELGEAADITDFSSGEELLENYPRDTDILLLDIMMHEIDGIDTARKLRSLKQDVCIIFVTSLAQYAIEGYRVRAFSFLTKPVLYDEFRLEVSAAVRRVQEAKGKEIVVKINQNIHRIKSSDVYYIEVQNHKISIHLADDKIEFVGKLADLEGDLKSCGFARCHVAFLVSFQYVVSVGAGSLILRNGEVIPVSRNRKKEFIQAMTAYLGGRI